MTRMTVAITTGTRIFVSIDLILMRSDAEIGSNDVEGVREMILGFEQKNAK